MDGNPTPSQQNNNFGITLEGGEGRNVLLGTSQKDTIIGGPEHDALIGRGGSDTLKGLEGDDSIIPFSTSSSEFDVVEVDGGKGFDRVYFQKNKSDHVITTCTDGSCDITIRLPATGAKTNLSNIEQLIFKDQTYKPPGQ